MATKKLRPLQGEAGDGLIDLLVTDNEDGTCTLKVDTELTLDGSDLATSEKQDEQIAAEEAIQAAVEPIGAIDNEYDGTTNASAGAVKDALNGATPTAGRLGIWIVNHNATYEINFKLVPTGQSVGSTTISATSKHGAIPVGGVPVFIPAGAALDLHVISAHSSGTPAWTAWEALAS